MSTYDSRNAALTRATKSSSDKFLSCPALAGVVDQTRVALSSGSYNLCEDDMLLNHCKEILLVTMPLVLWVKTSDRQSCACLDLGSSA